jgi:hypothetical protein
MAHYGTGHTLAHQHHLYSVRPQRPTRCPHQDPIPSPPAPAPSPASGHQLAACPSSPSLDSGSPSPVPAYLAIRVQGSRRPPGSGLHRSRRKWALGSVNLRRRATAVVVPRWPERRTRVPMALAPSWLARLHPNSSPHHHRPPSVVRM